MWFGTRKAPAGGYPSIPPGGVRDIEEFRRAKKFRNNPLRYFVFRQ